MGWIVGWKNSMNSAAIHIFISWKFVHRKDHPEAAVWKTGAYAPNALITSLGIGRTESLCLKRGNHFVENPLSKAFIKRSVTLQPSEEQRTT